MGEAGRDGVFPGIGPFSVPQGMSIYASPRILQRAISTILERNSSARENEWLI